MNPIAQGVFNCRRCLLAIAALSAVCILGAVGFVTVLQRNWIDWHFAALVRHQFHKLAAAPKIDVLLVGDSTLGYSIDADQWSRELNRSVVSVPLTGIYGFAGSLNMIQRATRIHKLSTVIIMQTPELGMRSPSYIGSIYTAPDIADALKILISEMLKTAGSIVSSIQNGLVRSAFAKPVEEADQYPSDYLRQGVPLSAKPKPSPKQWPADAIELENVDYLRKIAKTCRAERIKCIYVHGPLTDYICRNSERYFERLSALIDDAGLHVALSPICMPWKDTGDSIDHILPEKKSEYSRMYLNGLRNLIVDGSPDS